MNQPADDSLTAAFADRVFERVLGAMETLSIYLGDRLGLYRALDAMGPQTADELARQAGIHPRYAREWLEQQAVAGLLAVRDDGRFALPDEHAAVLTATGSLSYTAPLARLAVAAASRLPELLEAYRSGGGVPWAAFGSDARDAQGDVNRPWFESALHDALRSAPDVDAALGRPHARIADVGCGHGWSTIALARAYPGAQVVGLDVDEPSLAAAAEHAGGAPNVSFRLADATTLADAGPFDAAFVFEALHDMPHPVEVLTAMREATVADGTVVVMDEAVAPDFAPDGDEVERIMYAYSVFICLPDSMSTPGSAATGTAMRPATLGRYARDAGFSGVEVLPIDGFADFRFYRLLR
ncbi:class I SAM-dependent methyltransferase [Luteimicrobium xylanilyticum]|uniref:2-polyprenyl-6-hydroxyphenol methylase n=1 Tax=Luteimicrobium xylanilyticum TaxID=1133546 RepID=A0A5P9QG06_9MICO|nr:methyltransferase domain-containing protein [Luteimicrobium xylanilyticum]QFU99385.1 2-polyprenyl-6-hydroxyphenol methylase [Luteimicrobium xylanilyticum]